MNTTILALLQSAGEIPPNPAAPLPEPGAIILLLLGLLFLLIIRRRRRRQL